MPIVDMAERRTRPDRRSQIGHPIADDLRTALARDEIEVLFQPQFACSDNTLVGAEALARWQHPERGQIGAEQMFDIAERAGMVEQLSDHVARAALSTAGNWPVPLRLSLNVTAADVAAHNFVETIKGTLDQAGFPLEHLTLEITEQVLVADLARTAGRLRRLADLGIRIALDDFGAGFCNFDYLKRLPIDVLKLDRGMVEGITENPRDLAVLRGILAMALALGLDVTVEGVERQGQLDIIVREGCATWQGFLGAKPMTGPEFRTLVAF